MRLLQEGAPVLAVPVVSVIGVCILLFLECMDLGYYNLVLFPAIVALRNFPVVDTGFVKLSHFHVAMRAVALLLRLTNLIDQSYPESAM